MKFSVGDRVKFLNSKGGGVISGIIDSRMVSVAVEGGFDIPTLVSELIKVEDTGPAARFFTEKSVPANTGKGAGTEKSEEPSDERLTSLPPEILRNRKSEEIFLAFSPHDQKWLISGMIDIILVNNSSFDLLYNIYLRDVEGTFAGRDYGSCFPDSKLLLDTITREQIPEWESGYIQFLFHHNSHREVLPPFNSEFRISGQKFYNEASYRETTFTEGKVMLVKVVSITETLRVLKSKEEKPKAEDSAGKNEDIIIRYKTGKREAEVDLHIHELIEDPGSLQTNEILEFQRSFFERCLESAIANHFLRITFIHGVGNGVLREAILTILKKYERIEVLDAPMQKYGVGAIEVRIPGNY